MSPPIAISTKKPVTKSKFIPKKTSTNDIIVKRPSTPTPIRTKANISKLQTSSTVAKTLPIKDNTKNGSTITKTINDNNYVSNITTNNSDNNIDTDTNSDTNSDTDSDTNSDTNSDTENNNTSTSTTFSNDNSLVTHSEGNESNKSDINTTAYIIENKEVMKNELLNSKDLNIINDENSTTTIHNADDTDNNVDINIHTKKEEKIEEVNTKIIDDSSTQKVFTLSTNIPSMDMTSTTCADIRFSMKSSKYSFLSNFYCSEFIIDGKTYNHVEGYYQSQKFISYDPKAAKHISTVVSPMACKRIAYKYYFPQAKKIEWDSKLKDKIMIRGLYAKFISSSELLNKLIDTHNDKLIEDSSSDKYWGQDRTGQGDNKLGIMLMQVRSALRYCI